MVSTISKSNDVGELEKNSHDLYWDDLDKRKFLCLISTSSFVLRTCFHPLAVLKTRLQTGKEPVTSTLEMIKRISHEEGIRRGFYRGYSVGIIAVLFEPVFIGTLEITRHLLNNNKPKFISISQWDTITSTSSPAVAALVQQTFLVPIDVTCQRLMITRACDPIKLNHILHEIYFLSGNGIRGFYKGYLVTLSASIPFNSIMWPLYWKIQSKFEKIFPLKYNETISPLSAAIAALLTSLLTQPIDVLKTRLQVAFKKEPILKICYTLVQQRGFKGFMSGSIVRAAIVVPNSVIMMSLYELIKRASIKRQT